MADTQKAILVPYLKPMFTWKCPACKWTNHCAIENYKVYCKHCKSSFEAQLEVPVEPTWSDAHERRRMVLLDKKIFYGGLTPRENTELEALQHQLTAYRQRVRRFR